MVDILTMANYIPPVDVAVAGPCQVCSDKGEINTAADYMCEDCNQLLCKMCMIEHSMAPYVPSHSLHKLVSPELHGVGMTDHTNSNNGNHASVTTKRKSRGERGCSGSTASGMERPNTSSTQTSQGDGHLSDKMRSMEVEFGRAKATIDNHFNEIIQVIMSRKDEMLSKVRETHDVQKEKLTTTLHEEENSIKAIEDWKAKLNQTLTNPSPTLLQDIKTLAEEGEELARMREAQYEQPKILKFVAQDSLQLGLLVEKIGFGDRLVWQERIRDGDVWDVQFISSEILCVLRSQSLVLYSWDDVKCDFLLPRSIPHPGHNFSQMALAPDAGSVYLTCSGAFGGCDTVHRCDLSTGHLVEESQWSMGMFESPVGIAVSTSGIIYVSHNSRDGHQISGYKPDGTRVPTLGGKSTDPTSDNTPIFCEPFNIACHADDLVVCDSECHCVYLFNKNGETLCTIGVPNTAGDTDNLLNVPHGICIDDEGNILVADRINKRISKFDRSGILISHVLSDDTTDLGEPWFIDICKMETRTLLAVRVINNDGSIYVKAFQV